MSTDQEIQRDLGSKAPSGQWEWRIGAPAFLPARGAVCRLVLLLPSSAPLYVTMANPHVVLLRAEVPQGVKASWGGWAAGQRTRRQPKGAACRSRWRPTGRSSRSSRQRLLGSSVLGCVFLMAPHSSLHTAAPNPRARTNGITVSPVPSPGGRRGREGGGSRAPSATNHIPGNLYHPHHLLSLGQQPLPPRCREEPLLQVCPKPGSPTAGRALPGGTFHGQRENRSPTLMPVSPRVPLKKGGSQEWKEPSLAKRITALQPCLISHATLGKALPLQASILPPVPGRRGKLISPLKAAGGQSVCDIGFQPQPSQPPGPSLCPALQRRKKGDWQKCGRY